jgi:hypothetical protein
MRNLMVCILCLVGMQGFTQIRVGVQGGFNTTNFWQTDVHEGLPTGLSSWPISTFHAGVVAELDLGNNFVLQPALLYYGTGSHLGNAAGFVDPPGFHIGYSNTHLIIYSLRLPVNFLYKFRVNDEVKILLGMGPYIAKGVSGREKGFYTADSTNGSSFGNVITNPIDNPVKFSNGPSSSTQGVANVAPYDVGGDILAGVQYRKWEWTINFSRGFTNVYHNSFANGGNVIWSFSVAYLLFGHEHRSIL